MNTTITSNARVGDYKFAKYVDVRFDDWSDMIESVRAHANDPQIRFLTPSSIRTSSAEWSGSASIEEALHIAETGWPEATEQVQQMRDTIYNVVCNKVMRDRTVWDVAGAVVDVGAYVEGVPEHMMEFEQVVERNHGGGIIHLTVNISVNCMVKNWRIQNRGAAIATMVDVLENAGYRVEVTAVMSSIGDAMSYCISEEVPLKTAEQPLDLDRLVFALAHASMVRRFGFAIRERSVGVNNWKFYHLGHGGNYGRAIDHPLHRHEGATYIPNLDHRNRSFDTLAGCTNMVITWLRALEIPVDETAAA